MWAIAIYDEKARKLLLCVDRFNVKPLYVWRVGGGIAFASEMKAFRGLAPCHNLSWDSRGVTSTLLSVAGAEAAGHSLFHNVSPLRPGQLIEVDEKGERTSYWWHLDRELVDVPSDHRVQAEQFKEIFTDACRIRLRSDVPVATSLSGGLDSSSVMRVLSQIHHTKDANSLTYKAYIHQFPGTALDETEFAKTALAGSSMEAVWVQGSPEELLTKLDSILYSLEAIYPGVSDGSWRVYRAQRADGVKVSLDGHGADEYLGGYHDYTYLRFLNCIPRPWEALSLLNQVRQQTGAFFSWKSLAMGIARGLVRSRDPSPLVGAIKKSMSTFGGALRFDPLSADCYRSDLFKAPEGFDAVNMALYDDFTVRVLPRILRNFDLMSMAHGIEVRMPFLDYRLVKLGFSLPSDRKVGEGYTKLILREAMTGILPEAIRLRKLKLGFNSPLQSWLMGPLRPWVEEVLRTPSPLDAWVDRGFLAQQYQRLTTSGRAPHWQEVTQFWKYLSALRVGTLMERP
jgi:asparagine synthase (glutamine-hydrolysing)